MKNYFILFALILLTFSCKKDQKSGDASIISFSIDNMNQIGFTLDEVYIDDSSHLIYIFFTDRIPSDSLPIQLIANLDLTPGASSSPLSGEPVTFNDKNDRPVITVTAEDGTKVEYSVVLRDNQIPNSDFEDWYSTTGLNGSKYNEIGKSSATTVWATANSGTSTYGVYGTQPLIESENTVAQIRTGETSLIPVTAGTLFTGLFDINGAISNPTNPRKATKFGIPFILRPVSFKFKYTYQPGPRYISATLNNPSNIFGGFTVTDLTGNDMFTAYAILENRNGDQSTEIGRAEIVSGDTQVEMKEITMPFIYTSELKPTHITVVFSSSKDGDFFTGAVGSTLIIDDLELVY